MAEPASSTAAGIAIAAGAITLTGSIFGVQYDALLAGFFGGLIVLSYLPAMPIKRIVGSVASAAILAGYLAPVSVAAAAHFIPWLSVSGETTIRIAAAILWGIAGQVIIPGGLAWLKRKLEVQT